MLEEPLPLVRLVPGFGESSLNFTLNCHIEEITHRLPVEHELRKRIFKRFREEGIVIPFPQQSRTLEEGRRVACFAVSIMLTFTQKMEL